MRLSKLVAERTKDAPTDAKMKSHILLLRAGYMKQVANGIFSLSALGQKACLNIENIIRDEMNKCGGQEVKFPVVMPKELWDLSGRYKAIGSEMVRFKDRTGHPMLLGMTHEEAAVHLAKNWVKSYTQLPFMLYQIQTKFRDEPRSRGGLVRVREFVMKDAYSFHETEEDLNRFYNVMFNAYSDFYKRIGIKNAITVESDNGIFGGRVSHEFMYLTDMGEDDIVMCSNCKYKVDREIAKCGELKNDVEEMLPLKEVFTKDARDITEVSKLLKVPIEKLIKAVTFVTKSPKTFIVVFIRGDREVNETKLRNLCKREVLSLDLSNTKDFKVGNIGPLDLNVKNCKAYFDISLKGTYNMVVGANKEGYHLLNFNILRDMPNIKFFDLGKVNEGDECPKCGSPVIIRHGVEMGNIFQLGTKYTSSMGMLVRNKKGEEFNPLMGCYGIGIGRSLSCVVEDNCDENGICMPFSVAPYKVHIIPLRLDKSKVSDVAFDLYSKLEKAKVDTLIDDRECSAGIKFADADLMGMPLRVVISPRSLSNGKLELKFRKSGETLNVGADIALKTILDILKKNM